MFTRVLEWTSTVATVFLKTACNKDILRANAFHDIHPDTIIQMYYLL